MGTLHFQLPTDLNGPAFDELKRACMAGGQDGMPFFTEAAVEAGQLQVTRREDESGSVQVPWAVDGAGELMTSTATLIERALPYSLAVELARGKINQLRNQASEWLLGGLVAPPGLPAAIHEATILLGKAIACSPSAESSQHGKSAVVKAYAAADLLVRAFTQQVFQARHQRQPQLDTTLGCRVGTVKPTEAVGKALRESFNTICLPMTWAAIQTGENDFDWAPHDQMLDWAIAHDFHVVGGPLIDFSRSALPPWLMSRERNLTGIANFTCNFVAAMVKRFRGRIRTWQVTTGGNTTYLPGLGEDEMLWLTLRVAEAARQADANIELIVGVSQPWGEYLAGEARRHSPFVFADTLVRSGLNLACLDLEMVFGVWPRGSYCRDLLEMSRLIDLYSLLGVPLQITLGFPSDASPDKMANQDLALRAGHWRGGFSPDIQAQWAESFGGLALCKPSVRSVQWVHHSEAEPHVFPGCGLIDARGNVKPAMSVFQKLRAAHLR